jgi:hypothetical protein
MCMDSLSLAYTALLYTGYVCRISKVFHCCVALEINPTLTYCCITQADGTMLTLTRSADVTQEDGTACIPKLLDFRDQEHGLLSPDFAFRLWLFCVTMFLVEDWTRTRGSM